MINRFIDKIDTRSGDCWEWTAGKTPRGYGMFRTGRNHELAHRVSYALFTGAIPKDMCVCHSCDNPSCVNPGHLFLGTVKDNMRDMVAKERQARGSSNGNSKLTEKQVREIRNKYIPYKYSTSRLASEYKVSRSQISSIINRKNWFHI